MAKIVAVTSGKGGAGKSSISVGLATSFAKSGKKTMIIELDIGLRCIDIMLGIEDSVVFDLGDIFAENCTLEDAVVQSDKLENLFYIAAPTSIEFNFDLEKVLNCIEILKNDYDIIIIDTPAGLGISVLSVKKADMALIVTTPDPVCIRDAQKLALIMEQNGFSEYRLVINCVDKVKMKKSKIRDLDMVIDGVGAQLIGVVTYDKEYALKLSEGSMINDKHIFNRVFSAICKRVDGEYVPLVIDKI